tara:strand:- start:4105 stop:4281 length:177 start_codon:yes stop_codon:yes gene_type:complete
MSLCAKCKRDAIVFIINDDIALCEDCFRLEIQFGVDNIEVHNTKTMGVSNGTTTRDEQ